METPFDVSRDVLNVLQHRLILGPTVVTALRGGRGKLDIYFWLFLKPYKRCFWRAYVDLEVKMANNTDISPLNRGLHSVKGQIVNIFSFGGYLVSVATNQYCHCSV